MYAPAGRLSASPDSSASATRWLWAALVLAGVAFTLVVLVALDWRPLVRTDAEVARWAHADALAHPGWTRANRILSDWVWDPVTMRLLVAAAAVWLWLRRQAALALWCVLTVAVGTGVQQGLKALIDRDRPKWEQPVDSAHYAAMPSGHAMTAALAFGLTVWLVRRSGAPAPVQVLFAALACVSVPGVCVTRVVLGVHWLTDTLVGAMLGIALASAAVGAWYMLLQFSWKPRGYDDAVGSRDASGRA